MAAGDLIDPPLSPEDAARAKFAEDFGELMKVPTFRRWLWHVIEDPDWCAAFAYGANTRDPNAMYVHAGKREVGMELVKAAMAADNEGYKRMFLEATNLKVQRELRWELKQKEGG